MPAETMNLAEIDERLAIARANLRELVEQAAAYSGAADDDLSSSRISDLEAKIDELKKQREARIGPGAS